MMDAIVISAYLFGVVVVLLLAYKRRFAFLLCWPYVMYGYGLVVPVLFRDDPQYAFARQYVSGDALIAAALASTATLCIFAILDLLILGTRNFRALLENEAITRTALQLVQSHGFLALLLANIVIFAGLYCAAWTAGEIGGDYTFKGIERLTFWGPLGAATQALCALSLVYGTSHLVSRGRAKRRYLVESLLMTCLIARAIPGTRMPLVMVVLILLITVGLIVKARLRYILLVLGLASTLYTGATYIGYRRTGMEFELKPKPILYSLNGEAFNTNLSLLIATRNIDLRLYQPGFPIAIAAFVLPSWSVDKVSLVNEWYDRDMYARAAGFETVAPAGAMHFIADAMIAYGPYFFVPIVMFGVVALWAFRGNYQLRHLLLFIALFAVSHHLWRDSWLIAIKSLCEIYGLGYLALWLMAKRQERLRRKRWMIGAIRGNAYLEGVH
jgi:hypothetical protein